MKRAVAAIAFGAIAAMGCALTSRGDVLEIRYFTPEPVHTLRAATHASPTARPRVRLGRVRGAPHLRERIAHRESAYEVGFYDDRQWTDRPDVLVERALEQKLFEERGFERAVGGSAPALDVEVFGFEEVRASSAHTAHVALRYRLRDDTVVLAEQTVTVDRPVRGSDFEDFVAAMADALQQATDEIADDVAPAARPLAP